MHRIGISGDGATENVKRKDQEDGDGQVHDHDDRADDIAGSVRRSAEHSFADAALLVRGIGDFFDRVLRYIARAHLQREVHLLRVAANFGGKVSPGTRSRSQRNTVGEIYPLI